METPRRIPTESPGDPATRRLVLPLALILVIALHVVLTFYFEPTGIMFHERPISHGDFFTHAEQAWRVTEALDGWGKSWAYDIQLLAGYPSGTIFDTDNKGWALWTFALWKVGLARGTAFNLFVLLAHLMLPAVIIVSARLFRLDWWSTFTALCLAVLIWFFDSLVHRCWWSGMVAFATTSTLFLLPLGLMYRYTRDGGWWRAALMALMLAVGHLVHPYIFIVLAPPMLALYIRAFRRMKPLEHALMWGAFAFTLLANLWWIVVALRFWHYVLDSGYFGSSTLSYILSDYLGLQRDLTITGLKENRTGFRILAIGMAVAALVSWRKSRDDRFLPFASSLGAMGCLVYLGGYVWLTLQVQPYRFLLPLMFAAVIPAAAFVEQVRHSGALRRLPRLAWTAAGLIALVALPHLVRDVFYSIPALMPAPANGEPNADPPFKRLGEPDDMLMVARWLDHHHEGGRILVENGLLGEYLARTTHVPILGGFRLRNMQHTAANIFRRHPDGKVSDKDLRRYLSDYAVSLVIVTRKIPELEWKEDLLEPTKWIPPHRIYTSRVTPSYLQSGTGTVSASMNRIEVQSSEPSIDLVLRFHYLETLICTPDCTITREPVLNDPVGFIRVPAPHPADLVIENGY